MKIKILLLVTLLLAFTSFGFAANTFNANRTDRLATNVGQPTQSSFRGQYSGEWTAKNVGAEAGAENVGTWTISISSDGKISGTEYDKTAGASAPISGYINDEGFIKVYVKYGGGSVAQSGTLMESGGLLTGTLEQTCDNTTEICSNIDILLKRK